MLRCSFGAWCLLVLILGASADDNGLALTPPLGWRSFNAFWGIVDQNKMETVMDAMVDKRRSVNGSPTSLLELGYNHVGLDGGWNYCYPNNKTFHQADGTPVWCDWAKGRPCQGNVSFPDPQHMVDKAKQLGLSPGWYLNNCGCNEHQFKGEMVATIMKGSVKALTDMGWEGLKLDSCSQFNNLSWWNQLVNESSKVPVLMENCHQGAFAPGMTQWQAYTRNASTGSYSHELGYFSAGHDAMPPLANTSFAACKDACDEVGCFGFCFEDQDPVAEHIKLCYIKNTSKLSLEDLSSSNHCKGNSSPSDCPFNIYRTSGDIGTYWDRMLSNLGSTIPFLGAVDKPPLSRPGAWAYPDMLEVGRLKNVTESRTHFSGIPLICRRCVSVLPNFGLFSAWAVMSSPLILSFDLRVQPVMEQMWPIISNRDVLAVNQRWAGSPGSRLSYSGAVNGNVANSSQIWAKPLGSSSYAVLFMSTGHEPAIFSLPYSNVSSELAGSSGVCVRDLYTKVESGPFDPASHSLNVKVAVHDSAFFCIRPEVDGECGSSAGCPSFAA